MSWGSEITIPQNVDLDVNFPIPGVLTTDVLALAWFTVKVNAADVDPGVLQKKITPALVAGVGQITNTGASGTANCLFSITPANTAGLTAALPGTPGQVRYLAEVKVKTAGGKLYEAWSGFLMITPLITAATT